MKKWIACGLIFCLLLSSVGVSSTTDGWAALAEDTPSEDSTPPEDEQLPGEGEDDGETPPEGENGENPGEDDGETPPEGEDNENPGEDDGETPPEGEDNENPGEDDGENPPEGEGNENPGEADGENPPEGGDGENPGEADGETPPEGEDNENPGEADGETPSEGEDNENPGEAGGETPPEGEDNENPGEDGGETPPEGEDNENPGEDDGETPPEGEDGENPGEDDGETPPEGEDGENPGEADSETPPEEGSKEDVTPTGDAYILMDDTRVYGDIEELIPYGLDGFTIYLFHMDLIEIETDKIDGYDFNLIKEITFDLCPDEGTGFDSRTVVHVSEVGSYGQDQSGIDYIWAGRPKEVIEEDPDEEPAAQEEEEEDDEDKEIVVTEWELQVQKENYDAAEPCEPTFTLIPSPDAQEGMNLAVSINSGTPELLSSSVYHPSYSGTYRFVLLDEDDEPLAWSASFPVLVAEYKPDWSTEVEDDNTGDDETGDDDIGDDETGGDDIGDDETGDDDIGDDETGDDDIGDDETGDDDIGDDETGDDDIGDNETGDDDIGDDETSDNDIGDDETSDDDIGDDETGDDDIGDDETGDDDIGDDETGDDETGDGETGDDETGDDTSDDDDDADIGDTGFNWTVEDDDMGVMPAGLDDLDSIGIMPAGLDDLDSMGIMPAGLDDLDSMGIMPAGLDDLDSGMMVTPVEGTEGNTTPTPEDTAPASGQAYYEKEDGTKVYGDLETLLSQADTIYIATSNLIVISNSYASLLSSVELVPAHTTYNYVYVSTVSPDTNVESASSIFVKLDVKKNSSEEQYPTLKVSDGPSASAWTNAPVSFKLSVSDFDGLNNTYTYGVSVDGGSVLLLSQAYSASDQEATATYTASEPGKHTYEFMLIRHDGQEGAKEKRYVNLDVTAPYLTVTNTAKNEMKLIFGDSQSGFGSLAINGTAVPAKELTNEGGGVWTYIYSAPVQTTFKAGSIVATDIAGNKTANEAEFTLQSSAAANQQGAAGMAGLSGLGGFTGGSRGGSGGSSRTVYHSESDVESVIAYNAVELVVSHGGMTQLEIGDELLDLELSRNSFLVDDRTLSEPTFTADFASWDGGSSVDTLVLTVDEEDIAEGTSGYTWSFSGAVYKKLAASGIDYMMLCVGDEITALSTAGFTAGIRYNMYRAEGLPSKEFLYDVRMGMNEMPFEMDVTISGTTYAMSADTTAEMYYYDVYTGTADQFRALEK